MSMWEDSSNCHQIGFEYEYYSGSGGSSTTHSRVNVVGNGTNGQTITGAAKVTTCSFLSNGNVGIGTMTPSYNLEVNGTFYVSGNDGFSGMVVAFTGERSGTITATSTYSYGSSATSNHGPSMVKAGTVIGISFSSSTTATGTIKLYNDNSATSTVLDFGTYDPPSGTILVNTGYTTTNYSFSAGDRLNLRLTNF